MTDSETLQIPVMLWHPDGKRLALHGADLPVLEVKRHGNVRQAVRESWALEVWELDDAGISFGMTGTPRLRALTGDLPPQLSWEEQEISPLPCEQVWQRPDWPERATERLAQVRVNVTAIQPVHNNDLTSIVQAETPTGQVYLKTSSTSDEMRFTRYVSRKFAHLCPDLLACNVQEHWQVTASGGQLLDSVSDFAAWEQAVQRLIKFQQSAEPSELAKAGARSHPLEEMQKSLPAFLSDAPLLKSWGVSDENVKVLQDAQPTVQNALQQLAELNLPDLPAHGDAHPRNALHGEQGAVWFDWSETLSAAHPFMDWGWFLGFVLHPSRENLPIRQAHPDLETKLMPVILNAFHLSEAHTPLLSAAIPLAYLHRAVIYDQKYRDWQGNLPNWRPTYVPYYLREATRELNRLL